MKKTLYLISVIILAFYLFQTYKVTVDYSQSDRFADENDHMIGAYFMLQGKQLYRDISVVHQPLVYYFGEISQVLRPANSIFLFVKYQRLMIWVYTVFWNAVFLIFFGPIVLLFALIFEILRFFFIGNLLLAETLCVYPMIFIFGLNIKKMLMGKKLQTYEIIAYSAATFLSVFLLLQLWPAIFFLNLALLWLHRKQIRLILWQILPFVILTVLLFTAVSLKYYFQEVFVYDFRYYLPYMDQVRKIPDFIRMLFLPLTAIHPNWNNAELVTVLFLLIYAVYAYIFLKKKKLIAFLYLIFCLVLTNNRATAIKLNDFHLLPWLGMYFFLPVLLLPILPKKFRNPGIGIVIAVIVIVNFFNHSPFQNKKNIMTENDINYHDINKYGLAIKALRRPGDRLIAIPSDNLIHWVSETGLATRQIEYYGWQYSIPEDKARLINVFKNHPAEFIVNGQPYNDLPEFIRPFLDEKYVQVKDQGKPSRLYILKSILPRITDSQWHDFEYLLFAKPV